MRCRSAATRARARGARAKQAHRTPRRGRRWRSPSTAPSRPRSRWPTPAPAAAAGSAAGSVRPDGGEPLVNGGLGGGRERGRGAAKEEQVRHSSSSTAHGVAARIEAGVCAGWPIGDLARGNEWYGCKVSINVLNAAPAKPYSELNGPSYTASSHTAAFAQEQLSFDPHQFHEHSPNHAHCAPNI